ncbi:MAG: hypothetical protein IPN73_18705 [Saprospiraceae bacterium]|nr:hypothetical protein [Saprospiraceae bacterium]MBK8852162.1 hypothetical protein [Saprospiraceae bacterium]
MIKRLKLFYVQEVKAKFNLYSFLSHILVITSSVLLAQYITDYCENLSLEKDSHRYICLLESDINRSLEDLERDFNGHKIALAKNNKDLLYINKLYLKGKFTALDVIEFNKNVDIDYFYTDFQFYPVNTTFLSLLNQKGELLDRYQKLSINNLYYHDFKRIELLGKEQSQTRNLNAFWENLNDGIFYINPLDTSVYRRIDSKIYGESWERHQSSIRKVDTNILENIITKLEKTIEIREIKVRYYLSVIVNSNRTLELINEYKEKECITCRQNVSR